MRARRSVAVLIGFALLLAPAAAWAGQRAAAPSGTTGANLIALPLHRVIDTTGTSHREGPGACGDAGNAARLIFRAPADGTLRASTAASSGAFDPVLVVRDDAGRVVACNDDANGATVEANLVARVRRGHQYVLEVAGQAGSTGHTVLAALVAPGARPAVSGRAAISGVVTSSFDGGHINGICVTAYDAFDDAIRDTRTGMNGAYRLEGLPPSHLRVGFAMCPDDPVVYQSQFWKAARDLAHATPIITHNDSVVRGINAALDEFGSIGGTAFDVRGHHPLAGICVSAQSAISHALLQAITSVTGTYRIQVTTSAYQIQGSFADWWTVGFHDCTTAIEADQWYDGTAAGAATPAGAHPIHLDLGQAVTGIDAVMHAGGGITGTVRSLATGATQPGACVDASSPGRPDHQVTTDSSGRYRLGGLTPGAYFVLFSDCAHHKLSNEYWKKAGSRAAALAVHVTANQNVPNINANLSATGAIAGTVVDEKTHKPLGAVCVSAQGDDFGSAKTNPHGQFRISGLSFGPHLVLLRDCGSGRVFAYLPTYYDHSLTSSAATPVVVKPGTTTTITASLIRSGGIEGVVTGAAHHKPLVGVCVVLELPHTTTPVGFARTSVTGAYRIVAAPGSYDVQFSGCPGPSYQKQYWQGAADQHHATPVTVGASHDVTGIDAGLIVGATIAGHVFYYDGNFGISDTCAQARTGASPGKVIEQAPTNYDGSYALSGLPAGRYRVELGHCSGQLDFFAPTFAFDSPTYADATVFTVSGGQVVDGVDGNIDFGGSIQGSVRDSTGKGPVNGICVEAVGSDPDAVPQVTETYFDGSFFLGNLPPDTYHIRFGGHPSLAFDYLCHDTEVAQSWFPAALDESTSKAITLTVHQNRLGLIGTVFAPAQVTGFVTASTTGKPIAVPCATAYGPSGQLRGRPAQIAIGLYAVFDLPPDTYRVRIADCGHSGFLPQYYNGAATLQHATPIPLKAGQIRSDIDAALHPKAS